jgi:uncharacterized protein
MRKMLYGLVGVIALIACLFVYVGVRHIVFWSPTEDVRFESGDISLAGTLVKPDGAGPYPAIVMLHGSGPEPRADPVSRAVINTLVRTGYAVLIYDKRGVAESEGDFASALYADFINDGIAAVNFLAARPDIDKNVIGLYAVSEGGWLAPEIAVRTGAIAFIFNKVGPPISVRDVVLWEVRNDFLADGIAAEDVDELVELTSRSWNYYIAAAENPALASGVRRDSINRTRASVRRDIPNADKVISERLRNYDPEWYAEFAADMAYDPWPFLLQLDIPLYYTFGEIDINVPTVDGVAAVERLRRVYGKTVDYTVFPGAGHGLVSLRGVLDAGFVPGYLDTVAAWTAAQLPDEAARSQP